MTRRGVSVLKNKHTERGAEDGRLSAEGDMALRCVPRGRSVPVFPSEPERREKEGGKKRGGGDRGKGTRPPTERQEDESEPLGR